MITWSTISWFSWLIPTRINRLLVSSVLDRATNSCGWLLVDRAPASADDTWADAGVDPTAWTVLVCVVDWQGTCQCRWHLSRCRRGPHSVNCVSVCGWLTGHLPVPMTPEQMQAWTLQRELDERNRPMTDDEIEALLPTGYKVSASLSFN